MNANLSCPRSLARALCGLSVLLALCVGRPPRAAETSTSPARKGAILVENRAGADYRAQATLLEDLLLSRAAGQGITLLSRQVVTDALDRLGAGRGLDQALGEQSSALRLAQNLDADFILMASLSSAGVEDREFRDENLTVRQKIHTLRVSYKLAEAGAGAALSADTVKATKALRAVPGTRAESTELWNQLVEDCVEQLIAKLPAKVATLPAHIAKPGKVSVTILAGATDLTGQSILLPDFGFNEDGSVKRGNDNTELLLGDVTVEIDGVVYGSAPGVFEVAPGLHKLRLTREGFAPWERTFNALPDQRLKVSLAMSEAGFQRWQENIRFLNAIEKDRKLTDAEVKRIEGFAKMLEQSGYRVDVRGKSLYDGANVQLQNNMRN